MDYVAGAGLFLCFCGGWIIGGGIGDKDLGESCMGLGVWAIGFYIYANA